MNLFLILAAPVLLAMAGLRSYSLIRYNRRRRRRRKRPMGPDLLTVLLYIAAVVCLAAGLITAPADDPAETTPNSQTETVTSEAETESESKSPGPEVLIVNPWNPVPDGYAPDLVALDEYYGSAGMQVDRSCYEALLAMIDDCNAAGSRAYVLSSYRSVAYQQTLFDRKVANLMATGLSRADAETEAATVVVRPGTSEHHLGLAVDIIDTSLWALEEEQEDLPAQQWLMENCWRYGFILRYPKDKTAVTGVIYEPWHYRYVGTELAAELHETGLTLEEYAESLC